MNSLPQVSRGAKDVMLNDLASHALRAYEHGLDLDLLQRHATSPPSSSSPPQTNDDAEASCGARGGRGGKKADGPTPKRKRGGQTGVDHAEEDASVHLDKLDGLMRLCRSMPLACLSSEHLRRLFDLAIAASAVVIRLTPGRRDDAIQSRPPALVPCRWAASHHLGLASDLAVLLISRSPTCFQLRQLKKRGGAKDAAAPPPVSTLEVLLRWVSSVCGQCPTRDANSAVQPSSNVPTRTSHSERHPRTQLRGGLPASEATEACAALMRALASAALSSAPRPDAAPITSASDQTAAGGSEAACVVRLARDLAAQAEASCSLLTLVESDSEALSASRIEEGSLGLYRSSCLMAALTCEMAARAASSEVKKRGAVDGSGLGGALEASGKAMKALALQVSLSPLLELRPILPL